MRERPILFNTEMVKAILDGRKTCTRRIVKPQPKTRLCYTFAGGGRRTWGYPSPSAYEIWGEEYKLPDDIIKEDLTKRWKPPYHTDDILYVRETFIQAATHIFWYKADDKSWMSKDLLWKPSIHMPKDAARIWLKVTEVRMERLQEMDKTDALKEGIDPRLCLNLSHALTKFKKIWDSTIKKSDLDIYGWDADPWVWVIEFERCEKPGKEQ